MKKVMASILAIVLLLGMVNTIAYGQVAISEATKTTTGDQQRISARVVAVTEDAEIISVFCSESRDAAQDTPGIIPMTKDADSDIWQSAEFAADDKAYYVIAYDTAGNRSAVGTALQGAEIPVYGTITITNQNRTVDVDGDGKPDAEVNDLVPPEDIIDVSVPLNVMVAVQYVPGEDARFYSGIGTVTNNSIYSPVNVDIVEFSKKPGQTSTVDLVAWGDPAAFADAANDIALRLRTPAEMAYGSLFDVTEAAEDTPIPLGTLQTEQGTNFDFVAALSNAFAAAHKDDTDVVEFKNVFRFTKPTNP